MDKITIKFKVLNLRNTSGMKFTPTTPFSEKCEISTLGTNSITVKGTHHPWGTNSDVFCKFSTPPPPPLIYSILSDPKNNTENVDSVLL